MTPLVAVDDVDHPLNILFPFVKEHVELLHDGNVHELPGVHVTLPAVVLDAPPHVPEPPFLFRVIFTEHTGAAVPPAQVHPVPALLHAIHAFPAAAVLVCVVDDELATI